MLKQLYGRVIFISFVNWYEEIIAISFKAKGKQMSEL